MVSYSYHDSYAVVYVSSRAKYAMIGKQYFLIATVTATGSTFLLENLHYLDNEMREDGGAV
jgi:hypothetical protein